ncbi:exported hypothetical protein [Candidatus Sulfopaludibacter sp. SbA4]|nr:exported hypothetical protein [Candidatus Sulfopaludibacter sp. SbA4]
MRNSSPPSLPAVLVLVATAHLASAAEEVKIDRGRPVLELSARLVRSYGYLVTYEDAPPDAQDVIVGKLPNGLEYRNLILKPMVFHVSARGVAAGTSSKAGTAAVAAAIRPLGPDVIEPLLAEYNASGNPGKFTAIYEGEYAHIVPAGRPVHGKMIDFQPILSTVVRVDQQEGKCWDLLTNMLNEVQQTRGVRVTNNLPVGFALDGKQCSVHGQNLAARQVLIQLLDGLGQHPGFVFPPDRYVWTLVYDPTTDAWFLSTQLVPTQDHVEPASAPLAPRVTVPGQPNGYFTPTPVPPVKK